MAESGAAQMDAVVTNARAMARALDAEGVPVVEADGRATDSHTVLARVSAFGAGLDIAHRLEAAGIIVTNALLPDELGREGLRLGAQEVTRLGATEQTMHEAARLIADLVLERRAADDVASDAAALAGTLGPVRFAWGPAPA